MKSLKKLIILHLATVATTLLRFLPPETSHTIALKSLKLLNAIGILGVNPSKVNSS